MGAIRLLAAGTVTAVLALGASAVQGQEDAADEGPHYFFGSLEGYLHPDEDNPFGCEVGFTSDTTLAGETTLLGSTTVRQRNCYAPTDTLDTIQGLEFTFTGEGGDTLAATGGGDCIPAEVTEPGGVYSCWLSAMVTGGTGALAGATGEIHAIGYTFNVQSDHPDAAAGDVPVEMLLEGLIEY